MKTITKKELISECKKNTGSLMYFEIKKTDTYIKLIYNGHYTSIKCPINNVSYVDYFTDEFKKLNMMINFMQNGVWQMRHVGYTLCGELYAVKYREV